MKAAVALISLTVLLVPCLSSAQTAPEDRGTTGWTGGSREPDKANASAQQDASVANQPWMASGEDLNGPPVRFPANKTPE